MRLLCLMLVTGCVADRERFWLQTSDGAKLYTTVDGPADSDTLVLLLHGGPLGDAHAYNTGGWSRSLEAQHRMVYVDQRGQGASRGHYDVEDYDPARAAQDIAEVVDLLRLRYGADRRVVLLGHSWGGMLGSLVLLDTDAQVDGWIEAAGCHDSLLNPGYTRDLMVEIGTAERDAGRNADAWASLLDFAQGFDPLDHTYAELVQLNRNGYDAEALIDAIPFDADASLGSLLGGALARPARGSIARWGGAITLSDFRFDIEDISLTERLGAIDVPTLLLYGDFDFVCPAAHGEDAAARIPGARLQRFPMSGHSLMINEPEAFTGAILDFVDGL